MYHFKPQTELSQGKVEKGKGHKNKTQILNWLQNRDNQMEPQKIPTAVEPGKQAERMTLRKEIL